MSKKRKAKCEHHVYPEAYFTEGEYIFLAIRCNECDEIIVIRGDWVNKEE